MERLRRSDRARAVDGGRRGGQRIVDSGIRELDNEILSIAGTDALPVTRVVDAIELLASRERRLRLRQG